MPLGLIESKDILECVKRNIPQAQAVMIGVSTPEGDVWICTNVQDVESAKHFLYHMNLTVDEGNFSPFTERAQ